MIGGEIGKELTQLLCDKSDVRYNGYEVKESSNKSPICKNIWVGRTGIIYDIVCGVYMWGDRFKIK